MLRSTLADLLLPPGGLVLFGLAALMLLPPRWGRRMAGLALALLLLLGMPATSKLLLLSLDPPSPDAGGAPPAAIVILSGDVLRRAGDGVLEPGPLTLDRLRSGAALHRATGLPILVSGGRVSGATTPLAAMMARSLEEDFRVSVRWREEGSRDTWENAALTAPLLHEAGIQRLLLVTHVWHMRRALLAFRRAGLDPVPAPLRPSAFPDWNLGDFVPRPSAWQASFFAVHEWIGLGFYMLRR